MAKKEKQEVIKTYELGKDQWQLFLGMHEIAEKLKKLREDQFNTGIEFEVLELIDRFLK